MEKSVKDSLGTIMDGVCRALKVMGVLINPKIKDTNLIIFSPKINKDKNRTGFGFTTRHCTLQDFKSNQILWLHHQVSTVVQFSQIYLFDMKFKNLINKKG